MSDEEFVSTVEHHLNDPRVKRVGGWMVLRMKEHHTIMKGSKTTDNKHYYINSNRHSSKATVKLHPRDYLDIPGLGKGTRRAIVTQQFTQKTYQNGAVVHV